MVLIAYEKSLCKELGKIIFSHTNAHLKDGIGQLEIKQKKSHAVNRGPLYLEIAESVCTQVFQDASAPKPMVIVPLVFEPNSTEEVALWLGFSVRFDYKDSERAFILTSVSISLIRGSQTKDYLLRAEWDSRSENADHAQPHWHSIPGQAVLNNPIEERWCSIQSHLHLAMCARWRANSDSGTMSHTHALHGEDVISWVERTIDYAKRQIEYGLSKFPPSESQVSKPFF